MMSPTNPSRPAKLTAAPASTAARPSMASRHAPTFMPSAWAVSSPSAMMLSLARRKQRRGEARHDVNGGPRRSSMSTPAKPPTRNADEPM